MKVKLSTWVTSGLSLLGLLTMITVVMGGDKSYPVAAPLAEPAPKPFAHVVSGSALVEASSENIAIATPLAGVVAQVMVKAGQKLDPGEALFTLDTRQIDAEIAARSANVSVASARIEEALALQREAQDQLDKVKNLSDPRAVSTEEVERRQTAAQAAQARVQLARAQMQQAQAELNALRVEKQRMVIRAPVMSQVLQVNIRAGEFATPGSMQPLVVLGDTRVLHVRVDIDENDAWRIAAGARAFVYVRGVSGVSAPKQFVRFEARVVPKRNQSGASTERVDTRVLQVLFAFDAQKLPVYGGQQMDVFIEAKPVTAGAI